MKVDMQPYNSRIQTDVQTDDAIFRSGNISRNGSVNLF